MVWPKVGAPDGDRLLLTRTWMIVGAASFQLGGRVVIVAGSADDAELAAASASLDLTVIDPHAEGGIFPALMSALVSRSIVQVTLG